MEDPASATRLRFESTSKTILLSLFLSVSSDLSLSLALRRDDPDEVYSGCAGVISLCLPPFFTTNQADKEDTRAISVSLSFSLSLSRSLSLSFL